MASIISAGISIINTITCATYNDDGGDDDDGAKIVYAIYTMTNAIPR